LCLLKAQLFLDCGYKFVRALAIYSRKDYSIEYSVVVVVPIVTIRTNDRCIDLIENCLFTFAFVYSDFIISDFGCALNTESNFLDYVTSEE